MATIGQPSDKGSRLSTTCDRSCRGCGTDMISRTVLLLVCSAVATSNCAAPRDSAGRHIGKGDGYASAGRYSAAVIEYRNCGERLARECRSLLEARGRAAGE